MSYALYLTHPQVQIDADLPVPQWKLSEQGALRAKAAAHANWAKPIKRIISSDEAKALQTAKYFAAVLQIAVSAYEKMGENDRAATGFIPPNKFEAAASAFMNEPDVSYKGWETATAAQTRIVQQVNIVLETHDRNEPILFVGHGGVGTLLKCHLGGYTISRKQDQSANGGGNIFAFDLETRALLCDWVAMEDFKGLKHDA